MDKPGGKQEFWHLFKKLFCHLTWLSVVTLNTYCDPVGNTISSPTSNGKSVREQNLAFACIYPVCPFLSLFSPPLFSVTVLLLNHKDLNCDLLFMFCALCFPV